MKLKKRFKIKYIAIKSLRIKFDIINKYDILKSFIILKKYFLFKIKKIFF
jgi:hypothetical protein